MLPFCRSLLDDMRKMLTVQECQTVNLSERVGSNEYLFYSDIMKGDFRQAVGHIHILSESISKFFRKLIATKLEVFEQHDYQQFLNLDMAHKTYDDLFPLFNEV